MYGVLRTEVEWHRVFSKGPEDVLLVVCMEYITRIKVRGYRRNKNDPMKTSEADCQSSWSLLLSIRSMSLKTFPKRPGTYSQPEVRENQPRNRGRFPSFIISTVCSITLILNRSPSFCCGRCGCCGSRPPPSSRLL